MPLLPSLALIFAALAASFVLTHIVRGILLKRDLLDRPNERSSHKIPVPRGGGWAILLTLLPGIILTALVQGSITTYIGIILGTFALGFVSWLDDSKGASVKLRLGIHILAACAGSLAFSSNEMLFGGALPLVLDRAIMILGWAWFMNLYNFMDGIELIT